jgi:hypothetical protein
VDIANYSADIATIFIPNSAINTVEAESVGGDISANLIDGVVDYWIIVESDSATGNLLTVGFKTVATVDTLIYEAYTREELINTPGTGTDAASIAEYGTRAHTHIDRTLATQNEVNEKAAALLVEYKDLAKIVTGELLTDIFAGAHARVGQGVTVSLPDEEIDGDILGIIGIVWSIRTENGTYLDIPNLILSDTPPPLNDADWAAQLQRKSDAMGNSISTLEATAKIIPSHGHSRHANRTRYDLISASEMVNVGWDGPLYGRGDGQVESHPIIVVDQTHASDEMPCWDSNGRQWLGQAFHYRVPADFANELKFRLLFSSKDTTAGGTLSAQFYHRKHPASGTVIDYIDQGTAWPVVDDGATANKTVTSGDRKYYKTAQVIIGSVAAGDIINVFVRETLSANTVDVLIIGVDIEYTADM